MTISNKIKSTEQLIAEMRMHPLEEEVRKWCKENGTILVLGDDNPTPIDEESVK